MCDGDDVVVGPPESWSDFADRVQRQLGKGSRVFLCKQVGVGGVPQHFVMVLQPGPIRTDLLA